MECRRRFSDKNRQSMLVLRALDSNIRRQHFGIFKLCLRLCHIRFWRCPALEAVLRQPQSFGIGLHGIVQKSLLGVGAPNLEIVERNFGMETQTSRLQVSCACLGLLLGSCYAAANTTPQVNLIRQIKRKNEISVAIVD